MHDLGTLGGTNSYGYGINSSGTVAGESYTAGNLANHAFRYDTSMHDLGTLGGGGSYDFGINSSGTVAGYSNIAGNVVTHAFYYDTSMHDLGTLGGTNSYGYGINGSGIIAGSSNTADGGGHAFYYDSAMYDLNSYLDASGTGWTLQQAYAINDIGQITGSGTIGGKTHAYLLTVSTDVVSTTPEPGTWAMLVGMTVSGLAVAHRRKIRQA